MLWSLKKLGEPIFTFTGHEFTPETVRFIDHSKPIIASAAKDAALHILSESGSSIASATHENGFACMDTLRWPHPKSKNERIIVCADIK